MICTTTHIGQLRMICTTTNIGQVPLWVIYATTHIGQLPLWMICATTHIGQLPLWGWFVHHKVINVSSLVCDNYSVVEATNLF